MSEDLQALWDNGNPQAPAGFSSWGQGVTSAAQPETLMATRTGAGTTTITGTEALHFTLPAVDVPTWANTMDIYAWVQGSTSVVGSGNAGGNFRVRAESVSGPTVTPEHVHNWLDASGASTYDNLSCGNHAVPVQAGWKGTSLSLVVTAKRTVGGGSIHANTNTRGGWIITFKP